MVQLNFTTSKHGCHQQFLKHGQKFSFLLIWIMCFWFRKNSQGFLQQHRWQVMKSDGSYYNTMTSMLMEEKILRLSSLYSYDFGILINLCCITDSGNICLMRESIPLLLAGGLYICCQGRCWVWSTSKRQDDPESFIIHGRLYFSATLACVLGFLKLTSTQSKTYHYLKSLIRPNAFIY